MNSDISRPSVARPRLTTRMYVGHQHGEATSDTIPGMSHAYSRNWVHLVFSTKERREWIRDFDKLREMFRIIAAEYGVELLEIGGMKNHVHILALMPPKISVAALIRALKAKSSKWISEEDHLFAWQVGYGSFSVSASQLEATRSYIREQEKHHANRSYEAEFLGLLERYGIVANAEKVFV
jgi:putative transposase